MSSVFFLFNEMVMSFVISDVVLHRLRGRENEHGLSTGGEIKCFNMYNVTGERLMESQENRRCMHPFSSFVIVTCCWQLVAW